MAQLTHNVVGGHVWLAELSGWLAHARPTVVPALSFTFHVAQVFAHLLGSIS